MIDYLEIVTRAITNTAGLPDVRPDDKLNDLGLDSLDQIDLMMDIEDQTGVELPDEVDPNLTVQGLADLCQERDQ